MCTILELLHKLNFKILKSREPFLLIFFIVVIAIFTNKLVNRANFSDNHSLQWLHCDVTESIRSLVFTAKYFTNFLLLNYILNPLSVFGL